jgi:hypothetical protein
MMWREYSCPIAGEKIALVMTMAIRVADAVCGNNAQVMPINDIPRRIIVLVVQMP